MTAPPVHEWPFWCPPTITDPVRRFEELVLENARLSKLAADLDLELCNAVDDRDKLSDALTQVVVAFRWHWPLEGDAAMSNDERAALHRAAALVGGDGVQGQDVDGDDDGGGVAADGTG